MRHSSDIESHPSSSDGDRQVGARGVRKAVISGTRVSQSVSTHRGRLWLGIRVGGAMFIVIGMCLEPVEGSDVSHLFTMGKRRGLAKVKSMTDGRAFYTKGNLLYSPGGLQSAKLACTAFSK